MCPLNSRIKININDRHYPRFLVEEELFVPNRLAEGIQQKNSNFGPYNQFRIRCQQQQSKNNIKIKCGLDLYTCQNMEDNYNISESLKDGRIILTAYPGDDLSQQELFYQKSTQNINNSYEISFERNLIAQHSSVFKRELSNYMEHARIHLQKNENIISQHFPEGLYDLKTKMTCEQLLNIGGVDINYREKARFLEDLKHFDKLQEFLNVVADYSPAEISTELIQVSYRILQIFLKSEFKDNKFFEPSDILSLSDQKGSTMNVKLLNLKMIVMESSDSQDLSEKYQNFIEIYCATTLLVIGQFFENPYHEDNLNNFKRSLSPLSDEDDSEEGFQVTPQKKRKLSF